MIHVLTADVYNRIAAGEVVDRPYSVIKELVENAIDAGAKNIQIEIEGGGKTLVRVTDDGAGIPKEDLPRAYLPHATSKLKTAEDLFAIHTLGFRGEAIASIASVSRMKIVSKTADGEAYALASEGGVLGDIVPAGGANGTEVTVENLFFNTPARLKFLKSDTQEEGDVSNMIARFILSHPQISFVYTANGKVKYRSFGDGLPAAIAAVYGAGVLDDCHEISADKHGILLSGFIGNRNFSKPNRSYQSLFVNGRYVVNQTVSAAISNAYSAYLMKRQYPFYVLFLNVPTEIVDVNVHPNKADVRFADNQIIYGSVYSVISAVLDGNSRALEYLANRPKQEKAEEMLAPTPVATVESAHSEPERAPSTPKMTYEQAKKELAFDISPVAGREPMPERVEFKRDLLEVHSSAPKQPQEDIFAENQRFLFEQEQRAKQERVDVDSLTYQGELFRTYLIYELGDSAYLVDQHAAHERLIYDRLREKWEHRAIVSQPMLMPYVVSLNPQEFAFLERNFGVLRDIGFEIDEFGGTTVKISAVPADLMGMDIASFLAEVLGAMESLRAVKLTDILKDKLASAACKAAVKGGEKLTEAEARSLIERTEGDMGLKCPHGRPVAVKVKKSELEKLFKRIV